MGRAKKNKRRSASLASSTPATAVSAHAGSSSSQSGRPSQPASSPGEAQAQAQAQAQVEAAPPSAQLGHLRLVDSDDKQPGDPQPAAAAARQAKAKPAANQAWGRVGPRELRAILEPHFVDRPRLPSLPHSFAEAEDDVTSPRTPSDQDGSFSSDNGQKFGLDSNTPLANGKRLPKGYAVASIPSGTLGRQQRPQPRPRRGSGKSTTPDLGGHLYHQLHQFHDGSTPRGQRARNRELTKGVSVVGGEGKGHHPVNGNGKRDGNGTMASQQSKWREEMVLVICPGSQTTMAQLGCNELTPPTHRFPTRVFKDPSGAGSGYRPYHTYRRKKTTAGSGGAAAAANEATTSNEDDYEDVEDPDNVEGAIYPLQGGRIVNTQAFLAFLDHVHSTLTKTNHNTPIVIMASPQWTRGDCENIARYIFEKTKTPALSLLHSGIASQYGLKNQTVTVVDIGFEKVDVTCIADNLVVSQKSLGFPSPSREISGGEVFTQKLLSLLKDKGFTYDMAEQLKKSSLCEVLPYAPDSPDFMELPTDTDAHTVLEPAVAAAIADIDETGAEVAKEGEDGVLDVANIVTSGNTREFLAKKEKEKAEKAKAKKSAKGQEAEAAAAAAKAIRLPNAKKRFTVFHYEELVHEDVQVPVSSNGTTAKAEEAKPNPIPHVTATSNPGATNGEAPAPAPAPAAEAVAAPPHGEGKPEEAKDNASQPQPPVSADGAGAPAPAVAAADPAAAPPTTTADNNTTYTTERRTKRVRKDIEVGPERFQFADRGEIDRIVAAIYHAVQGIDEPYRRPACWDSLVFVGNGSRLRGLRENILQTLNARHLVSPSSATIFSSELPSNIATPSGTGSQTPTGSYAGVGGQLALPGAAGGGATGGGGVNPLLQAATTASSLGVPVQVAAQQQQGGATVSTPGGPSGGDITMGGVGGGGATPLQLQQQAQHHHAALQHQHHHGHAHGQTPTSIKLAALPTYLAEWTKNGFEEAMFLGALVFGRLVFCHNNVDAEALRMLSLTRVDYNELGPKAIRTHSCMP